MGKYLINRKHRRTCDNPKYAKKFNSILLAQRYLDDTSDSDKYVIYKITECFRAEAPGFSHGDEPGIFSKVDDLPPAKYNVGSDVKNSLIASGCIINSKVENSVLFKKVFVGKNCVIKNSVILNDVYIGDNTHIENCIVESRDTLKANTYYCGENGIKIVSENNERYVL